MRAKFMKKCRVLASLLMIGVGPLFSESRQVWQVMVSFDILVTPLFRANLLPRRRLLIGLQVVHRLTSVCAWLEKVLRLVLAY